MLYDYLCFWDANLSYYKYAIIHVLICIFQQLYFLTAFQDQPANTKGKGECYKKAEQGNGQLIFTKFRKDNINPQPFNECGMDTVKQSAHAAHKFRVFEVDIQFQYNPKKNRTGNETQ